MKCWYCHNEVQEEDGSFIHDAIGSDKWISRFMCGTCSDIFFERLGIEKCDYCDDWVTARNRRHNQFCCKDCEQDFYDYCDEHHIKFYEED